MFKIIFFLTTMTFSVGLKAQQINSLKILKKIAFTNDTIRLEKVSINTINFKLLEANDEIIDSSFYKINYQKAYILFNEKYIKKSDSLTINYQKFPEFLTKEYNIYNSERLVPNESGDFDLYKINDAITKKTKPFDGLATAGSITRGITVGNNQNSAVNSNLDLQITGKLSDKLSIKASIEDSNVPLRNGGYSQKLNQFDQIFIELFSDQFSIRAGDLFLENRKSKFLNFNKKVQGLFANVAIGKPEKNTKIFASAALVQGQYAQSNFVGQEGNQGPYKLRGANAELYILVVAGTENVFVNGILLKRGEKEDYIIDYNAGEIKFTPKFAITSEMRIAIEYQYTDRNFSRFVSYAGTTHEQEKWTIGGFLYSENDLKNQSLNQNLTENQVEILKNAGDNPLLMNAQSAFLDSFSTNKILYKKTIVSGVSIFEYTNQESSELYNVRFTFLGRNLGNYVLQSNAAIGKIFKYQEPINGILQGDYEPIIKLIAPTQIQIATVLGKINPSEKTNIDYELGISNNDKNIFSNIDDSENKGLAAKIFFKQRILSNKKNLDGFANYQFIQENFATIERLFSIEFNRDWNLTEFSGNQSYLVTGLNFDLPEKLKVVYQFEKLDFSKSFSGNRQVLNADYKFKNVSIQNQGSFLKSDGNFSETRFVRNNFQAKYNFKKNWIGAVSKIEDNKEKLKSNNLLSSLSQRFNEFGGFIGRGDSTKVFVEIGYLKRLNDSLQNNFVRRVNKSDSYFLKSKLIKTEKADLSLLINYRTLKFENPATQNQNSLNSKLLFTDKFLKNGIQTTTDFETNSGTIAQQEFTYLEVPFGQGIYTWNDYNNNGIQELQEFEIAPFVDKAKYVRVFLPNQIFIKTHQNKLSQTLILSPNDWINKKDFRRILSFFYNQTSFLIDRKAIRKTDSFDLNPFKNSDDLLGLSSSFRNSLFFNRGKQKHSITYTYNNSKSKNLLSVGTIDTNNKTNQLQYAHLIKSTFLISLDSRIAKTETFSSSYESRNFVIENYQAEPKITYLLDNNFSFDLFFDYQIKKNLIGELENLKHSKFGTSFTFNNNKKFTSSGEFSFINNLFSGNETSPAAFQMLEGLQAGKNSTWKLLLQKNLTQYLDLNINYQGRKSETSETIHTGNIQLKASF